MAIEDYKIVDTSTPEAAAEFKRRRDAGDFGYRTEAERQESMRLYWFWDRYYNEKMDYADFCDKVASGEIKPPAEHTWTAEKQFFFDQIPTIAEKQSYGDKCPAKMRVAIFMRHRDDGIMFYATCTFWNLLDGPSKPPLVKLKVENALAALKHHSDDYDQGKQDPVSPVDSETFNSECERQRSKRHGQWFELDNLIPIIEGL